MKRDREHVVPLVPAALALLGSVRSLRHDGDDALVFPSPQAGAGSLSAATVAGVMKSAGLAGAESPHGWRSTFRTWASERADADYAVMETSLSHAVGSAVERSYSRSTFLDKRRALLDAWSEFLAGDVAVIAEGASACVRQHRGDCPANVPKRVLQPAPALLQPAPRTSVRNA